MFGTPEVSFVEGWIGGISLIVIGIILLGLYKIISDSIEVYLKNNPKKRKGLDNILVWIYKTPRPIKVTFKVISTAAYIVICIAIIAYSA